ncbi:Eco57I restriction-modification methylase domain-containing protein [Zavarzinia sp.]|uniref:Eco57I restriction-modification methylase domain-containing protein n=1 Tax=Zavarzinia sp. TaxID=2027920 RepID=UPI003568E6F9
MESGLEAGLVGAVRQALTVLAAVGDDGEAALRRVFGHVFAGMAAARGLMAPADLFPVLDDGDWADRVAWPDWAAVAVDAPGAAYEALLDLPAGHRRKTSGSYYTPAPLVDALLDRVLAPVLDRAAHSADPVAALSAIRVLDPACGAGHFLLAAGRRIAVRLRRAGRADDAFALAAACLAGVDLDPLAVDLTRAALRLEAGRPVESRILCGDALLGLIDGGVLERGLPDEAFDLRAGDDPVVARALARRNRAEAPPVQAGDRWGAAADAYVAAFVMAKRPGVPVPTNATLAAALARAPLDPAVAAAVAAARPLHWPLAFPEVMARGGFDAVLCNPPWERIKLQEVEFFAGQAGDLAGPGTKAARSRGIAALRQAAPDSAERTLSAAYDAAKGRAEALSAFVRLDPAAGGRFPLTGRGDVNTYALFAELVDRLTGPGGRAGLIVPSGIATDVTTAPFFADLLARGRLAELLDFENRAGLFPAVDSRFKFCLLTLAAGSAAAHFAFFLQDPAEAADVTRRFILSPAAIARLNPNSHTVPVFRTAADAALVGRIQARVPVLLDRTRAGGNPWGLGFLRLFDMSNDSASFRPGDDGGEDLLPLYEAKMLHQFDHRWAGFANGRAVEPGPALKADPAWEPAPRYRIAATAVAARLRAQDWTRDWLPAFRGIGRATDERTLIATVLPRAGVGNSAPVILAPGMAPLRLACLIANMNSLVADYCARTKVNGANLNFFLVEQFPLLPPDFYGAAEIGFLRPRLLELFYTSEGLRGFARDLGHDGLPFGFDEGRRALLRAELDAFFAHAYGLTRDELGHILDAAPPSESFRVLKEKEIRRFGDYRTARLVLAAFDRSAQAPVEMVTL